MKFVNFYFLNRNLYLLMNDELMDNILIDNFEYKNINDLKYSDENLLTKN